MPTATRDRIRGKTLSFTFTGGPTKGKTYEHEFGDDGSVTYHEPGQRGGEKAKYHTFEVDHDVQLVSYLSSQGWTLTLALNFANDQIHGFASNDKQWFPVEGKIEK